MNKEKTTNKKNKSQNKNLPFIKTSDFDTMSCLLAEGFNLVDFNNGIWTFANCTNLNAKMNEDISKKIVFSNILCF